VTEPIGAACQQPNRQDKVHQYENRRIVEHTNLLTSIECSRRQLANYVSACTLALRAALF
jgi:hypothetical protein